MKKEPEIIIIVKKSGYLGHSRRGQIYTQIENIMKRRNTLGR